MIEVYHLNDEAFFEGKTGVIEKKDIDPRYYNSIMGFKPERQSAAVVELFNEGYYTLVAKVNTDSLDHAWQQTNHIDSSWQENEDVEAMANEARSSKVGDVMKDASGNYYIIASIGFTLIPNGLIAPSKNKMKM